ncbi:MAG: hypothetical protein KDC00_07720 [Flavobacteriales bacterium]|nr:hypothetical protein [Flavobacteriales bacterium]
MLVRLFRSNQPGVLAFLLLLVPGLFLGHVRTPAPLMERAMPMQHLAQGLYTSVPWSYGVFQLVLVFLVAVQLTALMNGAELVDRRNHLPALLFPLLLATLAAPGDLGPAFLGMPFLLWGLRRTWSITSGGPALSPLFDAGLLIGLAALCYMPYAFLLVVVWASVSVIRPFQWREYVLPLVGQLLMFYLAWGVLRLLGVDDWQPLRTILVPGPSPKVQGGAREMMLLVLLATMLAVSLFEFTRQYTRGVVREQNLRSSLLAFCATSGLLIFLVMLLNDRYPAVLLAAPLASLFTFGSLGTRRAWLSELAVGVLLALAIWKQYG